MTHERIVFESHLPLPAAAVYDWHTRPGAVERMLPPWQPIRVASRHCPPANGSVASFELGRRPFSIGWEARHEEVVPGQRFSDRQMRGPFRSWLHRHEFLPTSEGCSRMVDTIDYELPLSPLVTSLAGAGIRRALRRTFAYRHRTLQHDLGAQQRNGTPEPLRIAISGASGLIGSALAAFLSTAGHRVIRLVRSPSPAPNSVRWDPGTGVLEPHLLNGLDAVIHLAGADIAAGRWSSRRKDAIRRSRIEGTSRLIDSLSRLSSPPRHFLCASAVGLYGDTGTEIVDETSAPGEGFLTEVCREWEQAADRARDFAERVNKLRFGVVLSPSGGALAKMLTPFRLGAGGVVGSGRQYVSWISLDDAVAAVLHCLTTPSIDGPVNIVAPDACTHRELTTTLADTLRRPAFAPLPTPAVKLIFGEMGEAMLLASTRVAPRALEESGFEFSIPRLGDTLRHCLGRFATFPESDPHDPIEEQAAIIVHASGNRH